MKVIPSKPTVQSRGFTLVELLVVIAIMAVLAGLVTAVAQRALAKAASAKAFASLQQSGAILLGYAMERNGKMQYSLNTSGAGLSELPYNIVRRELELRWGDTGETGDPEICKIMHWNPDKLVPTDEEQNCFGVNFIDLPDSSGDFIVQWKNDVMTLPGETTSFSVKSVMVGSVSRPGLYPFLLDSSNSTGAEYFEITDTGNGKVGLRNSGKANAYFLDGSARPLDKAELKKAGFKSVYDNKTKPPKPVKL